MSDGGTQHSSYWKTRDNSMFLLCPTIRRVGQIQMSYHREVCCLLPHCVSSTLMDFIIHLIEILSSDWLIDV